MTVVDVNTGKFTGQGGNLEETVTRNNLEAAEEIVRQLRLRDVGGIVVIDFIDMVLESNRELVLRRLLECLSRDRTKHQVAEVTSLGLVQMTRKRVGAGLLEAFSTPCECCNGRGVILTFDPDSDGHAAQHTHSRGHGNGGHGNGGNGGRGNGGRGPSPAMVAARARSAESAESSAPAESSASAPAEAPPEDAAGAPAPAAAAASTPASADSADPNAAQVANGQIPDAEPAPARSSGRRRRRKPAAATAPADTSASQADTPATPAETPEAPTAPDTSATTSAAPETSSAAQAPGTPQASDAAQTPTASMASAAPGTPSGETSGATAIPAGQDGPA
jgi:ribonuclease E